MRILYIVDGHYPAVGGAELQAGMLSARLQDKGHEVLVICPRLRAEQAIDDCIQGVRVKRIDYPKVPYCQSLLLVLAYARFLWHHRGDYDAIHIHMVNWVAPVVGFLKPYLSAVVVAKFSGATEFDTGVLDTGLRHTWLHRLKNHYIRKLDHFQVLSQYTRRRLLNFGYAKEKIVGIPNGVDISRFTPTAPPAQSTLQLGFCGRVVPVKGLDLLLRAMAELQRQGRQIELWIAGVGPEQAPLKALAEQLGLEHAVHFVGALDDVSPLLQRVDVYLQPSYQEGLPNSVIEAMAAARPVIASRISGNEDVVQAGVTGLLFEAGDVAGLSAALEQLYHQPELRRQMGRAGRALIEREYQLDRVVVSLESLFQTPAPQPLEQRAGHKRAHER